jgi:hypothetical protein
VARKSQVTTHRRKLRPGAIRCLLTRSISFRGQLYRIFKKTVLEGVGPNHAGSAYSRPPDGHAAMRMYIAASWIRILLESCPVLAKKIGGCQIDHFIPAAVHHSTQEIEAEAENLFRRDGRR